MTNGQLNLIVDTNILVECKPLHEIDWTLLGDFREIDLIVCSVVIREIDNLKSRRTDRAGRRARRVHAKFRDMIRNEQTFLQVREADPIVKLFLVPDCVPSPALKERLDYSKPDHEIVGCLYDFQNKNPRVDVRIVSDDIGPILASKRCHLPSISAPEKWLRVPGQSPEQREINKLKAELAELERQEPSFDMIFLDHEAVERTELKVQYMEFQALSEVEIETLLSRLQELFPPATHTLPPEVAESERLEEPADGAFDRVYVPPNESDWEKYREESYPEWLRQCATLFGELHKRLLSGPKRVRFTFEARNKGTRPGQDVLVSIRSKGNFRINVPDSDSDGKNGPQETGNENDLRLPPPPTAPGWKWILRLKDREPADPDSSLQSNEAIAAAANAARHIDLASILVGRNPIADGSFITPHIPEMIYPHRAARDPNEFYWKDGEPERPVSAFIFECKQWRHGIESEQFSGELCFNLDHRSIEGALEFQIHAGNLSKHFEEHIPVRIVKRPAHIYEHAKKLIDSLLAEQHAG